MKGESVERTRKGCAGRLRLVAKQPALVQKFLFGDFGGRCQCAVGQFLGRLVAALAPPNQSRGSRWSLSEFCRGRQRGWWLERKGGGRLLCLILDVGSGVNMVCGCELALVCTTFTRCLQQVSASDTSATLVATNS